MHIEFSSVFALAFGFCFLLAACIWGIPIISWCSEILAKIKGKKSRFMDIFARQILGLSLLTIASSWIAIFALAGIIYRHGLPSTPWIEANKSLLAGWLGAYAIGSLAVAIYFLSWKKMKKSKGLHIFIGFIAVSCIKTTFFGAALIARGYALFPGQNILHTLPNPLSLFWPYWVQLGFLGVSTAAAATLVYLIVRRKKDDFGRDYYRYALKLNSIWAIATLLIGLTSCAWIFYLSKSHVPFFTDQSLLAGVGGRAFFLILSLLLWTVIARSQAPLRLKGIICISLLSAYLFICMTLTILTTILIRMDPAITGHTFLQQIPGLIKTVINS